MPQGDPAGYLPRVQQMRRKAKLMKNRDALAQGTKSNQGLHLGQLRKAAPGMRLGLGRDARQVGKNVQPGKTFRAYKRRGM